MKTLSLVIPCYNEEATLAGIVEEVLKLRSPDHVLELVIVDDASTDDTLKVIQECIKNYGIKIKVISFLLEIFWT